jgi:hypothetical protein
MHQPGKRLRGIGIRDPKTEAGGRLPELPADWLPAMICDGQKHAEAGEL